MSQDGAVIHFPNGLVGFPDAQDFRIFEPTGGYPLKFLQAVSHPDLSFVCMDAAAVKIDYEVPLDGETADRLALETPSDAMVLALLVVPEDPRKMTANLAGPLVINTKTLQGQQVMLDTKRYPLQYPVFASKDEVIIHFPTGLLGFPSLHDFRLFEPAGGYPLKFLQAVEDTDIAFSCVDVAAIKMDFEAPLSDEEAERLALEEPVDALVLAIVVIPEDPRKMTANLAGPLVINTKKRVGIQAVLNTEQYPLKYPILAEQ